MPMVSRSYCISEEKWFVRYRVEDLGTRQLVLEVDSETQTVDQYSPIFEGEEYNITMTVSITMSVPYAILTLDTNLLHSKTLDRYWEIRSSAPPTVVNYNPNEVKIKIKQEKGELIVSLYGKIPDKITESKLDGKVTLHKAMDYFAVELKGPNNEILDVITLEVIDSKIHEFQNLLSQKKATLQSFEESEPRVVSSYIELYGSIISQAENEAEQGFVDKAISLLRLLITSEVPREHVPSWTETLFIPISGGLIAVVAILGFLYLKSKNRIGYLSLVIEDQIRELEGLTFRASKIDKNLNSSLEEIKDRLKSIVGD